MGGVRHVLDPATLSDWAQSLQSSIFKRLRLEFCYGRKLYDKADRLRKSWVFSLPEPFLKHTILYPNSYTFPSEGRKLVSLRHFRHNAPAFLLPLLDGTAGTSGGDWDIQLLRYRKGRQLGACPRAPLLLVPCG